MRKTGKIAHHYKLEQESITHGLLKIGLTKYSVCDLPEVRQITKIRTICEALNKTPLTKTLLREVHKLLRLYLTLPVASATFEGGHRRDKIVPRGLLRLYLTLYLWHPRLRSAHFLPCED